MKTMVDFKRWGLTLSVSFLSQFTAADINRDLLE